MAINTARDLFLYELGVVRDAEKASSVLLQSIKDSVRNEDLAQLLQELDQASQRHLRGVNSCMESLGAYPLEAVSDVVEGIRGRFQRFLVLQPAPEMLDLFALSTAERLIHYGIASHRSLLQLADIIGERKCSENLRTDLVEKESSASKLERVGPEISQQLLAAA
jgi:ferritin-like metal-binding protein YciE